MYLSYSSLPTITELSITAAHTSSDRHKSIKEVFPEEDEANQDDTEEDKTPTVSNAKRHSRVRTTSTESPNKFSVKPVVNAAKRGSCGAADSAMTRFVTLLVIYFQLIWAIRVI